jgi:uncharacterized protein (TIGR00106 family)
MSVLIDFSIFPTGKGESISPYVARAVTIIRKSGLDYTFGPMGTSIEGEWDQVMGVVNSCFEELKKDCSRIYMTIKADYRKDKDGRLEGKVKSVQEKIM